MTCKILSNGSLSLLFNVEGTDYSLGLSTEKDSSGEVRYQIELAAGHKKVEIEKIINVDGDVAYQISGGGMNKMEREAFGQNWIVMVANSLESFGVTEGFVDAKIMGIEPFVHMFQHFFGQRLEELIEEINRNETEN